MELSLFIFIGAFIGLLFLVLGAWQSSIAKEEKKQWLSELQTARETGSFRPITQFPNIQPFLCIGCQSCIQACPEDGVIGMVNGVAQVIHGSRCLGHGRCADVCPVGAITVGLGNLSQRPDIPILTQQLETTFPNVFIAGELGGMALIRNAIENGAKVVDHIAEKIKSCHVSTETNAYDVLIVGAGPAGLSASLKCVEHGLKYKVIDEQDDIGGTVRKYPRRKLTLVQKVSIPLYGSFKGGEYEKEQLVRIWEEIFEKYKLNASFGTKFLGLSKQGPLIETKTDRETIRSRFVVLAIGRRGSPRKLGVPGEQLDKVMYQVTDASSFNKLHILIVGGGDSAIEAATAFANQTGNTVTLSYRKSSFVRIKSRNAARIQEYASSKRVHVIYSSEVIEIHRDSAVLSVSDGERSSQTTIPNHYVFILAGSEPPYGLLKESGIQFGGEEKQKAIA